MEPSLYKYIWRYSRQEQLGVLSLVLMSAPFYFFSLDLPKQIVNLISGAAQTGFVPPPLLPAVIDLPAPVGPALSMPWVLFGGFTADAFGTLVGLSLIFLALVVINGAFKMVINTRKGRMGERLLRRLRYELVDRVLRFPPRHYRKVKPSEVASMVKDEVEPLGTFIGDAIVWPAFLGMQAVVAILFILVQSVFLGAIACLILAVQFRLISYLREPILKLIKKRQIQARELAGRVGEIVDGVADIHVHDTSNYERADISKRLGIIYETRFEIYQRKFFVKFVNNFLANFTPFIFYLLGGSLVLNGSLDVGQLVAVIVAYKDLPNPIKELIDWYFTRRDVTIKYDQVIEQFQTADLLDGALQKPIGTAPPLAGAVDITSLSVTDDSGFQLLDALTLTVPLNQAVAVVGPAGCGKEAFGALFARQHAPSTGSIKVAGTELQSLPEGITGRRIGYAAAEGYFLPASLRDNILYGLKNEPRAGSNAGSAGMAWIEEARRAGNADFDPGADWIGGGLVGDAQAESLDELLFSVLAQTGLENDVFQFGLQARLDPSVDVDAAQRLLGARTTLQQRLAQSGLQALIEPFDPDSFNRNASLAENILFGTSSDPAFALNALAVNPQVRHAIAAAGLEDDLVEMGRSIAATMVELFRDFTPDHPFFEEFSFISAAQLPAYELLLKRALGPVTGINGADREKLLVLPFRYIEARHRLGLIDDKIKARIVEARQSFEIQMRGQGSHAVDFYEPLEYNAGATILDNVLFGRMAYGVAQASERVNGVVRDILGAETLEPIILRKGLTFHAGAAGKRLSPVQRQKISLARALIKTPDLLVVNGALSSLDDRQRQEIIASVLSSRAGLATFWVLGQEEQANLFGRILKFEHGRLVMDTTTAELPAARQAAQ